jgi:hypothetical protein
MQLEIIERRINHKDLVYKNLKIRICIICGYDKIESYEYGVSCEDCGTSFGRLKC